MADTPDRDEPEPLKDLEPEEEVRGSGGPIVTDGARRATDQIRSESGAGTDGGPIVTD
jgi:hypothetical protein